jgi:hypothetical protein
MSSYPYEEYYLNWQNIEIKITYHPCWAKIPDGVISHLDIESIRPAKARLPITDTGYLSHFFPADSIEADCDIMELLRIWLDERSQTKEWNAYIESTMQLSLF